MRWLSKIGGITIAAALLVPIPAMAAPQGVVRGRVVGPYRGVIVRPYVVRPYPYFYYGPAWYGYNYGYYPGWYYPSRPAYATGEVKIETHLKNLSLYVDGGYVGPVEKFKKFDLRPGNHDIEVRSASGQIIFKETVQVLVDRTVEIRLPE